MPEPKNSNLKYSGQNPLAPLISDHMFVVPPDHTAVVLITQAPGEEGVQYTLTLPDGTQTTIGESLDAYAVLADVIDNAFVRPQEALDLAIFALNTLKAPDASGEADLEFLDRRTDAVIDALQKLRSQLSD